MIYIYILAMYAIGAIASTVTCGFLERDPEETIVITALWPLFATYLMIALPLTVPYYFGEWLRRKTRGKF